MLGVDLFLLWLVNLFFPENKQGNQQQRGNGENNENWIILDHMNQNFDNRGDSDPFLNEEFNDGPDW